MSSENFAEHCIFPEIEDRYPNSLNMFGYLELVTDHPEENVSFYYSNLTELFSLIVKKHHCMNSVFKFDNRGVLRSSYHDILIDGDILRIIRDVNKDTGKIEYLFPD